MKRKHMRKHISFQLKAVEVSNTEKLCSILGDHSWWKDKTCWQHVGAGITKTEKTFARQTRLMPNIGGLGGMKRAMLCYAMNNMALYVVPVWSKIIEIKKYNRQLQRLQGYMLLRVVSAYRTVSAVVLQVITGTAPMDLQILGRTFLYNCRNSDMNAIKRQAINATTRTWQEIWDNEDVTGQWTKRLICRRR